MPVYRTAIDDNHLWYINDIFLVDIELQAKVITRTQGKCPFVSSTHTFTARKVVNDVMNVTQFRGTAASKLNEKWRSTSVR